jgi:hypothetical protein
MAKVSVELEGADRLARLFQRASDRGSLDVLAKAMVGKANAILNESKRIVPFYVGPRRAGGTLKDSGTVEKPKIDATGIEVEITYGGAAAAYAAVQHWDTTLNHPNGKQALYLLTPVEAAKYTFVRSVMGRYANYLKRG